MCRVILFAGTTEGRQIAEFLEKQEIPAYVCVATEYGEQLLPEGKFLEVSRVILFAGTTEGRQIAEFLEKQEIPAYVCVATEYGEQLLPEGKFLEVSHERLNREEMTALIAEKGCPLVIDATHPYAAEVTENIRAACDQNKAEYVRVLRGGAEDGNSLNGTGDMFSESNTEEKGGSACQDVVYADDVEAAVAYLEQTQGNILVTTGSKEAAKYTKLTDYKNRVYLRVLSLASVAAQCEKLGFSGSHLICMQGPFSTELNAAMLKQWNCSYLVTKLSGAVGGFPEKAEAARKCGCTLLVIGRPSELNAAMLKQWNCSYLVTKLSGAVGGFPEKAEAARKCGCTLLVIGRPLQESGISVMECRHFLCEKFKLTSKAEISLVGIGMGNAAVRTEEASRVIAEAQLLIGAKRMLDACVHPGQDTYCAYDSEKIAAYIKEHPEYEKIAVVLSGDVGFYSGAKKLLDRLGETVNVVCGISSVAYFMSRIQKSWEDVYLTSAHGRGANLIALLGKHQKIYSILGEQNAVAELAKKLLFYGMNQVRLYVGERLSYPDEKISSGRAEDFIEYETDSLSVVYLENPLHDARTTHGISDTQFIRDSVPMTKEEVRTVSLSKLRLKEDSICYDIGAGTGSVSIEMALRCVSGKVYAIEKKPEAVQLIQKNRQKFAADHLQIIEGTAPEALESLEAPTHAFIGGSSGNMEKILETLLQKNPAVRIVVNCIALESVSEAVQCMKTLPVTDVEIVQLSVSRAKTVGKYHMMMGENPIYIVSCTGVGNAVKILGI